MEKKYYWKIENNQNVPTKISAPISSNQAPGIILQPDEFCVAQPQQTSILDMQEKRHFIKIDRKFENKLNIPLAVATNKSVLAETKLDSAIREIEEYKEEV